jgi:hypothetical protein
MFYLGTFIQILIIPVNFIKQLKTNSIINYNSFDLTNKHRKINITFVYLLNVFFNLYIILEKRKTETDHVYTYQIGLDVVL